jgi:hypothetical protein
VSTLPLPKQSTIEGIFAPIMTIQGGLIAQQGYDMQSQHILQTGAIQSTGHILSAEGARRAAKATIQAADFNARIDGINTKRKLQDLSRQYQLTLGAQRAGVATSNLSITSKSFLMLQAEASDVFTRQLQRTSIDALNRRRATEFQTEVQATALENQARSAEYRSEVSQINARNQAAAAQFQSSIAGYKTTVNTLQQVPTLLGGLFGS